MRAKNNVDWIKDYMDEYVYKFMIGDIQKGIDAKANYLTALGLSVYTEHLGGLLTGNLQTEGHSKNNFKAFLKEMGDKYSGDEKSMNAIYKQVRCGLVHEYFIKANMPSDKKGMVAIRGNSIHDGLPDTIPGIFFSSSGRIFFFVENYFRDFKKAVEQYYNRLVTKKEEGLIKNFKQAVL